MSTRREMLQYALSFFGAAALVGCDEDPMGTDAGPMTGTDAGPNTGTDAGPMTGTDAGPMTGTDAGPMTDAGGGDACASVNFACGTDHPSPHDDGTIMIPAADVIAGTEQTYNIQGSSRHPHTIVVTAADFAMLAAGMTVMVTSSRDAGHTHVCTLSCNF